jgi:hypothetical protein
LRFLFSFSVQVKGASLFDQLEDLDSDACLVKAVELASPKSKG